MMLRASSDMSNLCSLAMNTGSRVLPVCVCSTSPVRPPIARTAGEQSKRKGLHRIGTF